MSDPEVLSDPAPNGMIARSHCLIRRPDLLFDLPDPEIAQLDRASGLLDRASGICEIGRKRVNRSLVLAT
jgi:hypothetical protein